MNRDMGLTRAIRDVSPEWADTLYVAITLPGDWLVLVPLLGLLYIRDLISTVRRSDTDESVSTDSTVFLIATVVGGFALVYLLKAVIGAPRPPEGLQAVSVETAAVPSGHTMAATVFWGALALWLPAGSRRLRAVVAAGAVTLVGLSRLGLGVHFLADVLAGVVFGVAYLVVVAWAVRERPERALICAFGIAAVSVLVTGGQGRTLLALGGIAGLAISWHTLESKPVRRRLKRSVVPALRW